MQSVILAMTGASGSPYFLRLLECCLQQGIQVHLLISKAGLLVLNEETDLKVPAQPLKQAQYFSELFHTNPAKLAAYGEQQWTSPLASGSHQVEAMVVCPCTTGALGAIANGLSDNLLERAADVMIKEHKKLILAVREMPLSAIHLGHMYRLAQLGVVIMPPNPGFYFKPQTLEDIVDFVVARILDHLKITHTLSQRWGEENL